MKNKRDVNYRPSPHAEASCSLCRYYAKGSGRCKVVRGVIFPTGLCDRFWIKPIDDINLPTIGPV